jgi:uncharacterized protein YkwD
MHRTTIFLLVSTLLCLLERPVSSAQGNEPSSDTYATLTQIVDAHNVVRAQAGLPALTLHPLLVAAAQEHAQDMAARQRLSHEGSDGATLQQRLARRGYSYERYGENVAAGPAALAEVMEQWRQSAPHWQNILGDFTELGAASAPAADGLVYWCIVFGRPATAESAPAAGN